MALFFMLRQTHASRTLHDGQCPPDVKKGDPTGRPYDLVIAGLTPALFVTLIVGDRDHYLCAAGVAQLVRGGDADGVHAAFAFAQAVGLELQGNDPGVLVD